MALSVSVALLADCKRPRTRKRSPGPPTSVPLKLVFAIFHGPELLVFVAFGGSAGVVELFDSAGSGLYFTVCVIPA